jgi:hypothetical protein
MASGPRVMVAVVQDLPSGRVTARWMSGQHHSDSLETSPQPNPSSALRVLANLLDESDRRQAAVNSIDTADD